jgi:hypothetical protein
MVRTAYETRLILFLAALYGIAIDDDVRPEASGRRSH